MSLVKVTSQQGKGHIIHEGHRFIRDGEMCQKVYWKCVYYTKTGCKGRIHTMDGFVCFHNADHNHVASPAENAAKELLNKMKEKAKTARMTPHEVIASCTSEVQPEVVGSLPSLPAMAKTLWRTRRNLNAYPALPLNLHDLDVQGNFRLSTRGEQFLAYDSGRDDTNRILIFATPDNLEVLERAEEIYGDGTFKTTPALFEQLYSVHAGVGRAVVPLAFCLMKRRTQETHEKLLNALKNLAPGMNPKTVTTDFEQPAINAFRNCFPQAECKGCFFHFSQCLWRKIEKLPDVRAKYETDLVFNKQVKCLAALAFVPPNGVVDAYVDLTNTAFFRNNPCLHPLLDYFELTWVGVLDVRTAARAPPLYSPNLWNVRQVTLDGGHRTTNHLEGWHRQLYKRVGCFHPNIWLYIEKLKLEQEIVYLKLRHYARGGPAPPKRLVYEVSDTNLKRAAGTWNTIGTIAYLNGVANNISLNM